MSERSENNLKARVSTVSAARKRHYSALTSELWAPSARGRSPQRRNLVMAQGHLIMAPIFKPAHQHQSGSYLEELHDLRLCHPPWIKPFITRWHFCPVLNACTPWESDEASETWRVMDNPLLCKGWQSMCCGGRWGRGLWGCLAVTSRPCQPLRLADAFVSELIPVPDPPSRSTPPPHLTWGGGQPAEEKSPTADGATYAIWPIQALCPCHMSLTLVLWLKHFKTEPFICGWDKKREGKGVRKSWHSLSSLQLGILWKGWHQEKNKIKGQQKQSTPLHTHKKRLPCTPTVPLTTLLLMKHSGPPGGDKTKRPSP